MNLRAYVESNKPGAIVPKPNEDDTLTNKAIYSTVLPNE